MIEEGWLTFTCAKYNDQTNHSYPRRSDPSFYEWLPLFNVQTDTFDVFIGRSSDTSTHTFVSAVPLAFSRPTGVVTVDVGISSNTSTHVFQSAAANAIKCGVQYTHIWNTGTADGSSLEAFTIGGDYTHEFQSGGEQFTVTNAAFTPASGSMTLTIPNHGFEDGDLVWIADGSLTFRCDEDSQNSDHAYPRSTDPVSGKYIPVSSVTKDTFIVNVGVSSNTTTHYFQSAVANGLTRAVIRTGGNYTHTLTGADPACFHKKGKAIAIDANSITFTCEMDDGTTNHTYPRTTDPSYKQVLPITKFNTDTFTVNVGTTDFGSNRNYKALNVETATYNTVSGNLEMTIPNSGLVVGDLVTIDDNEIKFTCAMDNTSPLSLIIELDTMFVQQVKN